MKRNIIYQTSSTTTAESTAGGDQQCCIDVSKSRHTYQSRPEKPFDTKSKVMAKKFLHYISSPCTFLIFLLVVLLQETIQNFSFHNIDDSKLEIERIARHETPITPGISSTTLESLNHQGQSTWIAGIVVDADRLHKNAWKFLMTLNCQHDFGVQLMVKENKEKSLETVNQSRQKFTNATKSCAPFIIEQENHTTVWENGIPANRVDRIAALRDYQRDALKESMDTSLQESNDGVVILVDLDLKGFPSIELILDQVQNMKNHVYPHDIVCSNGRLLIRTRRRRRHKMEVPFYYDTFATVFLHDTFSLALKDRLIDTPYDWEDTRFIRSDDWEGGNFTQNHMFNYFIEEGAKLPTGNIPVRSCFGGLALYRSKAYFDTRCRYELGIDANEIKNPDRKMISSSLMRYANKEDGRPCEHVVLHDCLSRNIPWLNVAVNPKLLTKWVNNDN